MSEIEARELIEEEYEIWDELVSNSPHGTIFHYSDWLTTCSRLLNKKLSIFGCFKNGQLIGGCSLFINKVKFLNFASSTTTMTPYGGVVLSQPESNNERKRQYNTNIIIKSLITAFENAGIYNVTITNSPEFNDVRPFIWNDWKSVVRYTYYLKLENNIEGNITSSARRSIRKAIKNNITIKKSNDVPSYYNLFLMTYKRQNLRPPVTKEFFEEVMRLLKSKKLGELWIAETPSGEIASAEIIIWDDKRAYRWSPASHSDLRSSGSTSLILYEIFHELRNKGYNEINLMGANMPHLTKFVSSFNPELVPYFIVERKTRSFKVVKEIYNIYKYLKSI